jgi:hypothetical protein
MDRVLWNCSETIVHDMMTQGVFYAMKPYLLHSLRMNQHDEFEVSNRLLNEVADIVANILEIHFTRYFEDHLVNGLYQEICELLAENEFDIEGCIRQRTIEPTEVITE